MCRVVLILKLKRATCLGTSNDQVHNFVLLVLVVPPPVGIVPPTANALSTAHTFASLFSDDAFYAQAIHCRSTDQFCKALESYVKGWHERKTSKGKHSGLKPTAVGIDENFPTTMRRKVESANSKRARRQRRARKSSLVWSGRCIGLAYDIIRRCKTYRKDWTDAVIPFDTKDVAKILSATLWQFFSTLVPAISIGIVYYRVSHKIHSL